MKSTPVIWRANVPIRGIDGRVWIPVRRLEPSEPLEVGYCEYCGREIYEGDEVYQTRKGLSIHAECWSEYSVVVLGAILTHAERG